MDSSRLVDGMCKGFRAAVSPIYFTPYVWVRTANWQLMPTQRNSPPQALAGQRFRRLQEMGDSLKIRIDIAAASCYN